MRRPRQYSGNWGPGTLVVTVFIDRCGCDSTTRMIVRVADPTTIGGNRFATEVTTSAASDMCDAFSSPICSCTAASRSTGSSVPTGRSYRIAETRLSGTPPASVPLTDTGTSVRRVVVEGSSPRAISRSR